MSGGRVVVASLLALAMGVGTAFLSRAPVRVGGEDAAALRLSWRVDALPVEQCRPRTPEELERLPAHMRTPTVCTGTNAAYVLSVTLDGGSEVQDTLRGSGARADRPVYVFREIPLAAGTHEVTVRFVPDVPDGEPVPEGAEPLLWSGPFDVGAGDVALITLAPGGRSLELR